MDGITRREIVRGSAEQTERTRSQARQVTEGHLAVLVITLCPSFYGSTRAELNSNDQARGLVKDVLGWESLGSSDDRIQRLCRGLCIESRIGVSLQKTRSPMCTLDFVIWPADEKVLRRSYEALQLDLWRMKGKSEIGVKVWRTQKYFCSDITVSEAEWYQRVSPVHLVHLLRRGQHYSNLWVRLQLGTNMLGYISTGYRKWRRQDNEKLPIHEEDAFSEDVLPVFSMPGRFPGWQRLLWAFDDPRVVTLSPLVEIGEAESSIPVLKQRFYTGTIPAISSTLANTPCADLGVGGILEKLKATLGTSYDLSTYEDHDEPLQVPVEITSRLSSKLPHSILKPYIERNNDFGTAYARLRSYWFFRVNGFFTKDDLHALEEEDQEMRRHALADGRITSQVSPRRVWDLCANRVVPWHWRHPGKYPWAISHAWMDAEERMDVWTPINGYQWPVPIPKDANLDLIRIEMLNLGAYYVWLDVLCLRQPGGRDEHLRLEEWKIDVPTIGAMYRKAWKVVYYFSGLGRPLSFKPGDFESDRCWFNRAWTLQEITPIMIIAGETGNNGMMEEMIQRRFSKELRALEQMQRNNSVLDFLSHMRNRVSTNPTDRVAGLAYLLDSTYVPTYDAEQSEESAWVALMNTMGPWSRVELLFFYPEPGNGSKYWRPSWNQAMANKLPSRGKVKRVGNVSRTEEKDDDWHEGPYIDSGYVQGLADVSKEGEIDGNRRGQLIIRDHAGEPHTFRITASHEYPIPDGSYVLLGAVTRCDLELDFEYVDMIHWVAGKRQDDKFKKWSVFSMVDAGEGTKLRDLRIAKPKVKTLLC
ncbi:hypothetical protein ARMGADRAFT_1079553 [Armillaria gallica]|uniref:Heterokaryon incompatibility domain-containing protein n=1 Tax=Armillaria gallica TaxID=47427 RepID=A0A2H3DJ13_ARMGA|nr:hypothetical protein ARMGADRAFT_1079553 [Armillaria gallica]